VHLAILVTAGSAALCALAFPPFGSAALLFIALAPALAVLEKQPPGRAALLGALHGTVYAAGISFWLVPTVRDYFERPLTFTLLFQVGFWLATVGIYHGGLFGVLALTRRALPRVAWLLLVPLAWAAADFVRGSLGLRSPWCRIGDAFVGWTTLRQLASATGVYGITAFVVLLNVVALALARTGQALTRVEARGELGARWRELASVAAMAALCACAIVVYAGHRGKVLAEGEIADSLRVALVQGQHPSELSAAPRRSDALRHLRRYTGLTREALDAGAVDLVVWPELALSSSPTDRSYGPPLASFVERISVPVLLGAPRFEVEGAHQRSFNSVFLLEPGGRRQHYDKIRLLPFSERPILGDRIDATPGDGSVVAYVAGREPGVIRWAGPTLGVLVCFEAVYPETARALVERGSRLLVNVANDGWFRGRGGEEQHLQQVTFRAIETGLPLLRATRTGITVVIGPDGSVLERLPSGPGALVATIDIPSAPDTLYARFGDLFALACLLLSTATLALAILSERAAGGLASSGSLPAIGSATTRLAGVGRPPRDPRWIQGR
jgi:apolipoprotein N-acyltransferase